MMEFQHVYGVGSTCDNFTNHFCHRLRRVGEQGPRAALWGWLHAALLFFPRKWKLINKKKEKKKRSYLLKFNLPNTQSDPHTVDTISTIVLLKILRFDGTTSILVFLIGSINRMRFGLRQLLNLPNTRPEPSPTGSVCRPNHSSAHRCYYCSKRC